MNETEKCHFWAGHFPEEIAAEYFVESRELEDVPVSAFARDQGVTYYSEIDHPRSAQGDGYWLHYLGTIEYRI